MKRNININYVGANQCACPIYREGGATFEIAGTIGLNKKIAFSEKKG
ncbi:MAG TPA: hypothetical protein VII00_04220 [bacterium]